MTPFLLSLLCDPQTGEALVLSDATYDSVGHVVSGDLRGPTGRVYRVERGIPRFVSGEPVETTVRSFGEEWNHFNFTSFKAHWLAHTVANTFGTTDAFRDKVIVDAGGGSGAQTLWMLESGARHVIMLELSHSVDDVVARNLGTSGFRNWDVVQCSIDAPPLRPRCIGDIVICHNVIQHTPSVERTARALYDLVGPGGELVFNCYPTNDETILRWIRFHLVYRPLRKALRQLPFTARLAYSHAMAAGRAIPLAGALLEKAGLCMRGDVPPVEGESHFAHWQRRYQATALNTFDWYGGHSYQHHKSEGQLRALLAELQPNPARIRNVERYFSRPAPIGCALRVAR
jgi:SAM-dependent methyltransferase